MYDVLIVEDDPMVLSINKRYVEKVEGFDVKAEAMNNEEALSLTSKYHFDLLLVDIHLTNSSGLELIKLLRQQNFAGNFIIITAEGKEESIQLCAQYGAVDYILKPFKFDRFQQSLIRFKNQREWLSKQETINQDVIDQYYGYMETVEQNNEAPFFEKGITQRTLQLILSVIDDIDDEFTIEQLTKQTNLSHVSIRKYINFLEEKGVLETKKKYGSVGRPVTHYSKIN